MVRSAYYFEYIAENHGNMSKPMFMKQINIFSFNLQNPDNDILIFSNNMVRDKLNRKTTVFSIQGFLEEEVFENLSNLEFIKLNVVYKERNGKMYEKSNIYSVRKIKDGIELSRGDTQTTRDIVLSYIKLITDHDLLNKKNIEKIIHTHTSNLQVLKSQYLLETALMIFTKKLGKLKELKDLYNPLETLAKSKTPSMIRYKGYILTYENAVCYKLYLILSEIIDSIAACVKSKKKFLKNKIKRISIEEFVEHTFTIRRKTVLITKKTNLSYNRMIPDDFEDVNFKKFIEDKNYKILNNLIIFPFVE
ncbi:hypothetical protein NGRA_0469 [Nosema granulosis]|uniref:Uncharacterized protein n=1 Tax=Nosema granulosis TaxID=83296 RepID=A0A9P6H099_9MICR|nr:hypothetical protein NGRA_0469 [Nosema granulosis]